MYMVMYIYSYVYGYVYIYTCSYVYGYVCIDTPHTHTQEKMQFAVSRDKGNYNTALHTHN